MKPSKSIYPIPISEIYPHPDNPRKNLGDLTEMVESIKKNGIMQNLTVIPGHLGADKEFLEDGYTLVIGHRRHAAAKGAGVRDLPCRIVKEMSYKEQVSTMLEENMQRHDLTIYEQAQGFQMMLDLGETAETIAEKTGFSKTTVYHRLNLAKLDQEILQEKEKSDSYQLTLKDLYELEQIENVEIRNRILKESYNSDQIRWKAKEAARKEIRSGNEKKVLELLKAQGVNAAPKGTNYWDNRWDTNKRINLDEDAPKKIRLKNQKAKVYLRAGGTLYVLQEAEQAEKKKTEEEIKREEKEKKKKQLKVLCKLMVKDQKEFIKTLISGKIEPSKFQGELLRKLWNLMKECEVGVYPSTLCHFFTNKRWYDTSDDEKLEAKGRVEALSIPYQMMLAVYESMSDLNLCTWDGKYNDVQANKWKMLYEIFKQHGYSFPSAEEEQLLNGSHELYEKSE